MNKRHNQIFILTILLLFLCPRVEAKTYFSFHGGQSKVLGDDPGIKNRMKGNIFGTTVGWRLPLFLSLEVGLRKLDSQGTVTFNNGTTPTQVTMDVSVASAGARIHLLTFISAFGGLAYFDYDSKASVNGAPISTWPLQGKHHGKYWGVGLRLPFVKIDLYADLMALESDKTGHLNTEFGLRYYF